MTFQLICDSEGQALSFSQSCNGFVLIVTLQEGSTSLSDPEPRASQGQHKSHTQTLIPPGAFYHRPKALQVSSWGMEKPPGGVTEQDGPRGSLWNGVQSLEVSVGQEGPAGHGNAKPAVPKILPEQQQHHRLPTSAIFYVLFTLFYTEVIVLFPSCPHCHHPLV